MLHSCRLFHRKLRNSNNNMVGHNRNEVGSSEHDRESGKKHAEMAPKSVRLTRRLMIVLDVLDITAVMLFLVVIQFQVH